MIYLPLSVISERPIKQSMQQRNAWPIAHIPISHRTDFKTQLCLRVSDVRSCCQVYTVVRCFEAATACQTYWCARVTSRALFNLMLCALMLLASCQQRHLSCKNCYKPSTSHIKTRQNTWAMRELASNSSLYKLGVPQWQSHDSHRRSGLATLPVCGSHPLVTAY